MGQSLLRRQAGRNRQEPETMAELALELARVKRELAEIKMERDILKLIIIVTTQLSAKCLTLGTVSIEQLSGKRNIVHLPRCL